jgi:hypothetical protein
LLRTPSRTLAVFSSSTPRGTAAVNETTSQSRAAALLRRFLHALEMKYRSRCWGLQCPEGAIGRVEKVTQLGLRQSLGPSRRYKTDSGNSSPHRRRTRLHIVSTSSKKTPSHRRRRRCVEEDELVSTSSKKTREGAAVTWGLCSPTLVPTHVSTPPGYVCYIY